MNARQRRKLRRMVSRIVPDIDDRFAFDVLIEAGRLHAWERSNRRRKDEFSRRKDEFSVDVRTDR